MSTGDYNYGDSDLSHPAWLARLDEAHVQFVRNLDVIKPKTRPAVEISEWDPSTGKYQFVKMDQVGYSMIEHAHPDAVCLL
jgi:hypothetical protein